MKDFADGKLDKDAFAQRAAGESAEDAAAAPAEGQISGRGVQNVAVPRVGRRQLLSWILADARQDASSYAQDYQVGRGAE
jgi:hypothetical protein